MGVAAADAPSYGRSVQEYAPKSAVAQDYEEVAERVLEEIGV